ncbi:MAG: hypothetical protein IKW38_03405 [Kiritimatiellae bacterium]|nr:hypothetical protein [Kiritimatiellia bacterium]
MKTSALLLCMSLMLPLVGFAQEAAPAPEAPVAEAPAMKAKRPAPTPEQREAFRKRMAERRQRMACQNPECPCAKVMNERPNFPRPQTNPAEMTPEQREAFRTEMKTQMEAFRAKMEEARKACTCEECICKRRPAANARRPMPRRGDRPGKRRPMKGPEAAPAPEATPAPQAPAPEAAPAA